MKAQTFASFVAVAALVGCGGGYPTYTATLAGAHEVPPVTSSGTGNVTATLNGTTLTVSANYSGLSGAAQLAHIHGPADAANTAAVACPLQITESATVGTGTLAGTCTSFDVANLNAGMFYVNVHTAAHGGGEIRGQLAKQ